MEKIKGVQIGLRFFCNRTDYEYIKRTESVLKKLKTIENSENNKEKTLKIQSKNEKR